MSNIPEITAHGFSVQEMQRLVEAISAGVSSPVRLRFIGFPDLRSAENLHLEHLDTGMEWQALSSALPENDDYSQLLRSKSILPKVGGACLLNVVGEPSSLSLCMFLLNLHIYSAAFDRLAIVSPIAAPLSDLILQSAGEDKEALNSALSNRSVKIFEDLTEAVAFLLTQ